MHLLQGLGNLQSIGQDLVIRGNAALTSLLDLTKSLRSVGAFRGADVFIEDNPNLTSLAGLGTGNTAIYGDIFVQGNSQQLPASEVNALKAKAVPVPITVEVLQYGLPRNISRPATAAPAANITAAPALNHTAAPAVNATAAPAANPSAALAGAVPVPSAAAPAANASLPGAAAAAVPAAIAAQPITTASG